MPGGYCVAEKEGGWAYNSQAHSDDDPIRHNERDKQINIKQGKIIQTQTHTHLRARRHTLTDILQKGECILVATIYNLPLYSSYYY